ncbi:MAG TPA: diacylglycerol kinase family protein [Trebonia sp.]|nr:diacylglycerol kinase family protein [Trebonia sp.]
MRALLIINPRATSMSGHYAGLVVRELRSQLRLETVQTRYRGHARELAAASAAQGYELIVTFGGDGTVNEVVNGLMTADHGEGHDSSRGDDDDTRAGAISRPAIAPIPGGGANVFARTLGVPLDPAEAVQGILAAVGMDARRTIGLGLAASVARSRYFTFSAGLGLDAEVVSDVEQWRASGRRASAPLYMWTALRRYYTATDRQNPALTLSGAGAPPSDSLFMGVVTNSSPWTYVGRHPVLPVPHTDFNSGLDVFALRRLSTLTTFSALGQMMHMRSRPVAGRDVITAEALSELGFHASRPIAFHIDGEYLGETEKVSFRYVPDALSVFALCERNDVIDLTPNSKHWFAESPCAGRALLRG